MTSALTYSPSDPSIDRAAGRRWTTGRACLLVAVVAGLVRLWSAGSFPLVITNDGFTYLLWGAKLWAGADPAIPPFRTPGYPLFLAGVFSLFGYSGTGVVVSQHLLGWLTALTVTFAACRLGGTVLGTVAGLLMALEPALLCYESYALSGTLTTWLVTTAAVLATCLRRPRLYVGLLIGVLLALACLVRPSAMVFVPFFILGWLLASYKNLRSFGLGAVVCGVGLFGTLAPWLIHNADRGIYGLASGSGGAMWYGMARFGLIEAKYAPNEELREKFNAIPPRAGNHIKYHNFMRTIDGMGSRSALMKAWSRKSLRDNWREYLEVFRYALGWQVRYFPQSGPWKTDELDWFLWRRSQDGDGWQLSGKPPEQHRPLTRQARGGLLRSFFSWWSEVNPHGVPQIPMAACALILIVISAVRRQWALCLVLCGGMAFLVAHATLLATNQRYILVASTFWYGALAAVPSILIGWVRGLWASRGAGRVSESSSTSEAAATR